MKTRTITQTGILLAAALAIQAFRLPTYVTGPAVNAVLLVGAVHPGMPGGILIGSLTPWAALGLGILNPVAAPLVPVIMTANAVFVAVFGIMRNRSIYLAALTAAAAKYLVFYISINCLLGLFGIRIPSPLLAAFQLPQLFTALIGGGLGVAAIRILEKTKETEETKEMKESEQSQA